MNKLTLHRGFFAPFSWNLTCFAITGRLVRTTHNKSDVDLFNEEMFVVYLNFALKCHALYISSLRVNRYIVSFIDRFFKLS